MRDMVGARLREGQTLQTSATLAGIHRDTLHDWRRRGQLAADRQAAGEELERSEVPFLEFHDMVLVARAEAQAAAVLEVRTAGAQGNVSASRWFLERSFPDEWGPRSPAEVAITASQTSLSHALARGRALREAAEAEAAFTVDGDASPDAMPPAGTDAGAS